MSDVAALPRYVGVDAPPVRIPEGRTVGPFTGVQVSPDGHIWLLHIANHPQYSPLGPDEKPGDRMPAVCEFDCNGNFLQGWGGPDWLPREDGRQQWPNQEETISFDAQGTIWVFGADVSYDHAVQRFTRDGKLLLRIGKYGECGDDDSTDRVGCPTDCWHDVAAREVYVTDGYVNHRVVVFDSDTGAFKRAFGAYGKPPAIGPDARAHFNNPVHAISLGPDGLLYVCDRKNDRVQVFDAVGREEAVFLREIAIDRPSPFGTCFSVVFTPDAKFMVICDGNNSHFWTVDLAKWEVVDDFRPPNSENATLEGTVHKFTADLNGDLILARTAWGVFRMRYEGNGAAA